MLSYFYHFFQLLFDSGNRAHIFSPLLSPYTDSIPQLGTCKEQHKEHNLQISTLCSVPFIKLTFDSARWKMEFCLLLSSLSTQAHTCTCPHSPYIRSGITLPDNYFLLNISYVYLKVIIRDNFATLFFSLSVRFKWEECDFTVMFSILKIFYMFWILDNDCKYFLQWL